MSYSGKGAGRQYKLREVLPERLRLPGTSALVRHSARINGRNPEIVSMRAGTQLSSAHVRVPFRKENGPSDVLITAVQARNRVQIDPMV
jgi:hypothetical protein